MQRTSHLTHHDINWLIRRGIMLINWMIGSHKNLFEIREKLKDLIAETKKLGTKLKSYESLRIQFNIFPYIK
jgi:hypothetical protein